MRREIGMDLNTGKERGAGKRKKRQGQLSQQTFLQRCRYRETYFWKSPLGERICFSERYKSSLLEFWGGSALFKHSLCLFFSCVSGEETKRENVSEIKGSWSIHSSSQPARMQCLREGRRISDGMSVEINAALHRPLTPSDQAACCQQQISGGHRSRAVFTKYSLMWFHIHQLFSELSANYKTFKDLGNNHIVPKPILNYRFLNKEEKI